MGFKTEDISRDLYGARLAVTECIPPFTDAEFTEMENFLAPTDEDPNVFSYYIDSDYAKTLMKGCLAFKGNPALNKEPATAGDMAKFVLASIEGKLSIPKKDTAIEEILYYLVGGTTVVDGSQSGHGIERYMWAPNSIKLPTFPDADIDGRGIQGIDSAIKQIAPNTLSIDAIKKALADHGIVTE